jgi:hypothetical protein
VVSWLAIAGTVGAYVILLAVTAAVALRYVTGAADPRTAVSMGVAVAAIGAGMTPLGVHPAVGLAAALLADVGIVRAVGAQPWRRAVGVVVIHMVVSVLVGTVGFGLLALIANAPG